LNPRGSLARCRDFHCSIFERENPSACADGFVFSSY
jgi:hypothetical protein